MRNGIPLLLICCCVLNAQRRDGHQRDFLKTATLAGGKSFRIEHSNGDLNIRAVPGTELRIQAAIRCSARSLDQARGCADNIQINVDESSTGVSVRTVYPRTNNVSYDVDYEITMPENAPLDVRNRFGSVSVSNLHATANIHNSNGPVTFTGGRGQQRVENSFGNVDVRANDGDFIVVNNNGNVAVNDVTGKADIRNRFGEIRVTNAGRGLTINSGNGNIDAAHIGSITYITNTFGGVAIRDARGDVTVQNQNGGIQAQGIAGAASLNTTFDRINASRIGKGLTVRAQNTNVIADTIGESAIVETTFGAVDLRSVTGGARVTAGNTSVRLASIGGEVYVKSSFAGVDVSDAGGPITVENQNGYVKADLRPGARCQPIALSTTFSPIRVAIPSGGGYNVTARTSFGKIHSDHEMMVSGSIGQDALSGKINGGGCELRLTGQNGNIDILKGK